MANERASSALRERIAARDEGVSELRNEFDRSRNNDLDQVKENEQARTGDQTDRGTEDRQLANEEKSQGFSPQLAEKGHLQQPFDRARQDDPSVSHMQPVQSRQAGNERTGDETGLRMVKDDQPTPAPRPPENIREAVDREAFAKRWADAREASETRNVDRSSDFTQERDERQLTNDR